MINNCPNKNSNEWQYLVKNLGEDGAYKVFIANGEEVPDMNVCEEVVSSIKPAVNEQQVDNIKYNSQGEVLAPNGNISKLYKDIEKLEGVKDKEQALQLYKQTRSKEFKEWFGDSKVVDDNGEPLIVYHYNKDKFDIFDKNKATWGVFFFDVKGRKYHGDNKYAVFLNSKNTIAYPAERSMQLDKEEAVELQNKGYDGVIGYKELDDNIEFDDFNISNSYELVVFEPNQIKSVFNQGTFSQEEDSILLAAKVKSNPDEINYALKSVRILQSDKAKQVFEKGNKNKWDINKILQELQIPKEQKQLVIDSYNEGNKTPEQLAIDIASKMSYSVEVKTAKLKKERNFDIDDDIPATEEEFEQIMSDTTISGQTPTQYYSNLTVPGGTNYTENRIITPQIVPSIKGHANFAEENDVGWSRSDDRTIYSMEHIDFVMNELEKSGQLKIKCD